MSERKINIAIVGLGFGAEFIPIYQRHPNANMYAICQRTEKKLHAIGDAFGIETRYTDLKDLLKDPNVDAVHINSPIPDHAAQSIAALKAGKHVACTVPMATSIKDCKKIVDLVKKTGLTYMMMETVVYAREYLFMKELLDAGKLGKLQFVQASHQQDMDGWPNYWPGLPPMWYATHCVGPVAGLIGKPAEYVSCFGSGTIRKELVKNYGSSFAVETAHIKFKGTDVNARIIRSLFDTARQYRESIDVYGDKASVEWPLVEHEPLIMHTANVQAWTQHTTWEFSYKFEAIEILTPAKDASGKFVGLDWETVIYDPEALAQPVRILWHRNFEEGWNTADRLGWAECTRALYPIGGYATQVAPGEVIEFEVPDMFGRPWARIWEKNFEQNMDRPKEELDLGFK